MRILIGVMLWASLASSQIIPGRYMVELQSPPLGAQAKFLTPDARGNERSAAITLRNQIRTEQKRVRAAVEQHSGKILSTMENVTNAFIVTIPDERSAELSAIPGVKKVYAVQTVNADLDHALPIHHVPQAWSLAGGANKAGANIKVGILDSGISINHPGFQDSTLVPPAGYPLVSKEANRAFTNNKVIVARSYEDIYQLTDPDDAHDTLGHGTGVAMCAAGVSNKGPLATISGVAPKAFIGVYKITPLDSGSASGDVIVKALDDALADGMDVINISYGSLFVQPLENDLVSVSIDRMLQFGVLVFVSAGNSGPNLNTIGNFASNTSAVSVGAIENDRVFGGQVSIPGSQPFRAYTGVATDPFPTTPITGPVFDVSALDQDGLGCVPFAAGSLQGKIALILRGTCGFVSKATNAKDAGAIAVILYTNASPAVTPSITTATIPTVLISNADGLTLKAAVAAGAVTATVQFIGVTFANPASGITSFSSRGPTYFYGLKPDISAVGSNVYTAVQTANSKGEIYDPSGYEVLAGTSFAAPIMTGAAAVLKAARPGLTALEYRSLLINGAATLLRADGSIEKTQISGPGILDLQSSVLSTVATYPTSLSFGIGDGFQDNFFQLTVTNVGDSADTFSLSTIEYDGADPPQFSQTPYALDTTPTLTLQMKPHQSQTVYVYWFSDGLDVGEYQGQMEISSAHSGTRAQIPYWYGVPSGIPTLVTRVSSPPPSAPAGATLSIYYLVTDETGYAIKDSSLLKFKSAVTVGDGTVLGLVPSVSYANLVYARVKLSATPGPNTFLFQFGNTAPVTVSITGNKP